MIGAALPASHSGRSQTDTQITHSQFTIAVLALCAQQCLVGNI